MDLHLLLLSVGITLAIVLATVGFVVIGRGQARRRIRDRLNDVIDVAEEDDDEIGAAIVRDLELSTIPALNALLQRAQWARRLDTLLVQADVEMRLGAFVLLTLVLGVAALTATMVVSGNALIALAVAAMATAAPVFVVVRKKNRRVRKFEEQFPDALDMLTNALRAGMAFTGAIQVVAEELPDPVAKEFAILFEENRLGLDMKDGLKKMAGRVDSGELRLFVTAVILQRETGGNLAEILENTAAVIRDRFRILGDVRTLTAQARLSGFILMALPLLMAVSIFMMAPDYLKGLASDSIGRLLIGGALFLQVAGVLIMRRIVDIKV